MLHTMVFLFVVDVKILHTNQHVVLEKHSNPMEEGPVDLLYICPL